VTVVPFLAFAIGVDDTYVMLGAWQDTKRNLSPEKRMALSLEEAGSAITVRLLNTLKWPITSKNPQNSFR